MLKILNCVTTMSDDTRMSIPSYQGGSWGVPDYSSKDWCLISMLNI